MPLLCSLPDWLFWYLMGFLWSLAPLRKPILTPFMVDVIKDTPGLRWWLVWQWLMKNDIRIFLHDQVISLSCLLTTLWINPFNKLGFLRSQSCHSLSAVLEVDSNYLCFLSLTYSTQYSCAAVFIVRTMTMIMTVITMMDMKCTLVLCFTLRAQHKNSKHIHA